MPIVNQPGGALPESSTSSRNSRRGRGARVGKKKVGGFWGRVCAEGAGRCRSWMQQRLLRPKPRIPVGHVPCFFHQPRDLRLSKARRSDGPCIGKGRGVGKGRVSLGCVGGRVTDGEEEEEEEE